MTATGFIVVGKKGTSYGFKLLEYGTAVPDKYDGVLMGELNVDVADLVTLSFENGAQPFNTTANVTFENGITASLTWTTDHYEATDANGAKIIRSHYDGVLNFNIEGIVIATKEKPKRSRKTKQKTTEDE